MPNELTLRVIPEIAATSKLLRKEVEKVLRVQGLFLPEEIIGIHVRKRSIDARGGKPMMQLQVQVFAVGEETDWKVAQAPIRTESCIRGPRSAGMCDGFWSFW